MSEEKNRTCPLCHNSLDPSAFSWDPDHRICNGCFEFLGKKPAQCPVCGTRFIPDYAATIYGTVRWNEHTWMPNCEHYPKGMRINIG